MTRIKEVVRVLLDRSAAGRGIAARPDDRFIVSYPKSGNTWMRFLLANLFGGDVGFGTIEERIPDIYLHSNSALSRLVSPRYLKSHEYFDPRYAVVLYLVRDPRDVVVSYFHHHRKFEYNGAGLQLGEFVDAFLDGKLDPYGSWAQNVGGWLGACSDSDHFKLIRYEDLKREPGEVLGASASHLGIAAEPRAIRASVEASAFDRMQRMERDQGHAWQALKGTREDMAFVRKGEVDSWKEILRDGDTRKIEERCGRLMRDLGYL